MKTKKQIKNHNSTASESIVALCTPQGRGALALLRVSGVRAIAIVDCVVDLPRGGSLAKKGTHTIHYGHVCTVAAKKKQKREHIDQVLFFVMHAPCTFTGEDTVEISCHNNPFIIEAIIEALCEVGARRALPGEFTQRAVMNNKLDLVQAEAIHDLIMAPSTAAAKKSLAQLEGSLTHFAHHIESELVRLASWVEASFEFLDEEQRDVDFDGMIRTQLGVVHAELKRVLASASRAQHIREGVRVALVGSVNAGKSTLLNRLLGKKRAIVSPKAGTTRDSIEAGMTREGMMWTFIDTAGLRETYDHIEQEGVERAHAEAKRADLVLLVCDGTVPFDNEMQQLYASLILQYKDKLFFIINKADRMHDDAVSNQPQWQARVPAFVVSAKAGNGIAALEAALFKRIHALYTQADTPFLLNQRQHEILLELNKKLCSIEKEYTNGIEYEVLAYELGRALELLTMLTGHGVSEKVMDSVFRTFCVGK